MRITANSHRPHLYLQNSQTVEASANSSDGIKCGNPTGDKFTSELVFIQEGDGQYVSFDWQYSQEFHLQLENIIGKPLNDDTFAPVDVCSYLQRLQRILTSLVPERFQCWFRYQHHTFELDLAIAPMMPGLVKLRLVFWLWVGCYNLKPIISAI